MKKDDCRIKRTVKHTRNALRPHGRRFVNKANRRNVRRDLRRGMYRGDTIES
jgi:hypothetical protein